MDYQRHYDLLIERARNRVLNGYVEVHHVVPSCLGGSDDRCNLVQLTAAEHFVAHQLLCRLYPHAKGLFYALIAMSGNPHGKRNNKAYSWIRKQVSVRVSQESRERWANPEYRAKHKASMEKAFANPEFGKKISAANTGKKVSAEARANIAEAGRNREPRKFSEQAKKNMAEARKRTWAERRARGEHLQIAQKIKEARIKNGSYVFSEEHRANIGKAGVGRTPWNKGIKSGPATVAGAITLSRRTQ